MGLAHRLLAVTLRVIFGGGEEDFRPHRPKPAGAIVDASLPEVPERSTAGRCAWVDPSLEDGDRLRAGPHPHTGQALDLSQLSGLDAAPGTIGGAPVSKFSPVGTFGS